MTSTTPRHGQSIDRDRRLDASVIIPVHNAEATLADQLGALSGQRGDTEFDVIVVLNRCSDRSAAIAEGFQDRLRLRVIRADDKASAAYARNTGARQSSAPRLLFCDADDRVGERWVAEMLKALDSADFCGGALTIDRSRLATWAYERFYRRMEGPRLTVHGKRILYPVSATLGCRREAFSRVSGFDEGFTAAAGEEVDLAIRLLRSGFRVGLAPGAHVLYRPRTSFGPLMRQQKGYVEASVTLACRYGVPPQRITLLDAIGGALRRIAHGIVRKNGWSPLGWTSDVLTSYYKYTARRERGGKAPDIQKPEAVDFVAPLSAAVIGGLAFEAPPSMAKWYARSGIDQISLSLVAEILRRGDSFVDVGAGIGILSVAAALRVGTGGSVVAVEPDPPARLLLARNLQRHGVADRADVRREAAGASAALGEVACGVDMIRIAVEGLERDGLRDARGLIERNPDAVILLEAGQTALQRAGSSAIDLMQCLSSGTRFAWLVQEGGRDVSPCVRPLDDNARSVVTGGDELWCGKLLSAPAQRRHDIERIVMPLLGQRLGAVVERESPDTNQPARRDPDSTTPVV
ncbi:MAG: glycosyltransferase [Acidobacteria bacterium]|nr:glycosyltransferase [Acidobacteriota bacterium]